MASGGSRWQRITRTALAILATLGLAASPPPAAAIQGSTYTNITAFTKACDPSNYSSYPAGLRLLAMHAFTYLGYQIGGGQGSAFSSSLVLARAGSDQAFYVHSHGDHYYQGWGFREDAGRCSGGVVAAPDIRAQRWVPSSPAGYVRSANLVVASTCHLGESASNFPDAFGIDRKRSLPDGTNYQGRRFFLGYVGVATDADQYAFEARFWTYATTGHNLGESFDLAMRTRVIRYGSVPTWYGTYAYSGTPALPTPCYACL
jgi:hypothetical protein